MATITVRNLDKKVKDYLKVRAAKKGHSMEAEVRAILEEQFIRDDVTLGELMKRVRKRFEGNYVDDLEPFPRNEVWEPKVDFSGPEYDR